ncbi:cbb3-type cytochrome oxidase assembly protein CcoS [Psychrobacter urativorans]|uniref:cbb3-type cytochrome oxidase assembly protein CcoS n=1 Tax=Psychrobacter urativorans TaxID=45610 RepID=UPI001918108F|nr:cbb3-type cytochrome oxidase assembly protein CcoS [Psychrobacter urativorans]
MLSIFLLIPLSLMLFVVAIWAVRYAVKSNQFEDLDNASQRIILDDRQERRQTIQAHDPNHIPKQANQPSSQTSSQNETDSTTDAQTTDMADINSADSVSESKKLTDK